MFNTRLSTDVMRLAVMCAAVVATMFLGALPANAHHSYAMYDSSTYKVFTGVVVRVVPAAAHFEIHFVPLDENRESLVRGEDGEPQQWVVEMLPAAQARRIGITPENFPRGTVFSVGLHPLRNGKPGGDRGAAGMFRCPEDVVPEPGMHCDSVEGGEAFGKGVLPVDGVLPGEH